MAKALDPLQKFGLVHRVTLFKLWIRNFPSTAAERRVFPINQGSYEQSFASELYARCAENPLAVRRSRDPSIASSRGVDSATQAICTSARDGRTCSGGGSILCKIIFRSARRATSA